MTNTAEHQDRPLAVRQFYGDVARHLEGLNTRVQELETACKTILSSEGTVPAEVITQFQTFDFMRQSLGDLAGLFEQLGHQDLTTEIAVEAVQSILTQLQMTETKALLRRTSPHPSPLSAQGAGNAVFF